jgi:hypothetical protein
MLYSLAWKQQQKRNSWEIQSKENVDKGGDGRIEDLPIGKFIALSKNKKVLALN